jgi:hypothetical protein
MRVESFSELSHAGEVGSLDDGIEGDPEDRGVLLPEFEAEFDVVSLEVGSYGIGGDAEANERLNLAEALPEWDVVCPGVDLEFVMALSVSEEDIERRWYRVAKGKGDRGSGLEIEGGNLLEFVGVLLLDGRLFLMIHLAVKINYYSYLLKVGFIYWYTTNLSFLT